jgi:predicted AAA+ superfamily ATPase
MSLKPWRDVVKPHRDVSSGRFKQAEFAADLAQVLRGTAEVEYQDPVEFLKRTYLTVGISQLLADGLRRLSGEGGEPVIQVKTAFGGGKTHAMLSLYHLLRSPAEVGRLDHVASLLSEEGIEKIPEAKIAVMVGTALSASGEQRDPTGHGLPVKTLWGEMAAQLGGADGYEMVATDDRAATAPGSDKLVALFGQCGPCLVLIDEMVAFIRNLYEVSNAGAGTFDANLTFIQSLTEAVRATKNVLLVASIPQSEIEVGGEGGKRVLEHVQHTFGRIQRVWRAADALEGFEIVRRRLFGHIEDEQARDDTCAAFHEMYRDQASDFPADARETAYLDRLKRAYPIHPEVFDRLYEDWSTVERFQRTRGVLRLLAAAIHELWTNNDHGALIMPGSLPLYAQQVASGLTEYLPDSWNAVIDADVDGSNSAPHRLDQDNQRIGEISAARRVARTIFLGSAPSVGQQRVRGVEKVHVLLGTTQPGEHTSVYSDALGRLEKSLAHLYQSSDRYWFDDKPTLRRTMENRAQGIKHDEVLAELERRLRDERTRGVFRGVHACPDLGGVPDDETVRLVILKPEQTHRNGKKDTPGLKAATDILQSRSSLPRERKNMLLFVAPDEDITDAIQSAREHLAWQSIWDDRESLNLDVQQHNQVKAGLTQSGSTTDARLRGAYHWLLVPEQDGTSPIEIKAVRIAGDDSIVERASKQAESSELVITRWAPQLLRMELDRWLWKDEPHIHTDQLWKYLVTYCYLPRLKEQSVLMSTIREGARSTEWFGYATGLAEDGTYVNLVMGPGIPSVRIDTDSVLVKPEVAAKQLEAERGIDETGEGEETGGPATAGVIRVTPGPSTATAPAAKTRFYGTVKLDASRVGGDAAKIADEVVRHLAGLIGADVRVTLDISATVEGGFPAEVVRTVSENARTLGFEQQGFEEQ